MYQAKSTGRNRTAVAGRNWGELIDMHLQSQTKSDYNSFALPCFLKRDDFLG
jgi:hypothetical protein